MNKAFLKTCKACGKEVSRYSPFCRHCGHPQGVTFLIWLLIIFLLFMLASYIAFMIYCAYNVEEFQIKEASQQLGSKQDNSVWLLPVKESLNVRVCKEHVDDARNFSSYPHIIYGLHDSVQSVPNIGSDKVFHWKISY